jgi:hypothetical protein
MKKTKKVMLGLRKIIRNSLENSISKNIESR